MFEKLKIGDRIQIGGGYDMEPKWLNEKENYTGVVKAFIPGQSESLAAVVELDEDIKFDDIVGNMIVLELRYVGAKWKKSEIVHVELCDFIPEEKSWKDRRQGKWVESHALYKKI